MSKLEFETTVIIKVTRDGKHVGDIKAVKGGWSYFPKGSKSHGDVFPCQLGCMRSLE